MTLILWFSSLIFYLSGMPGSIPAYRDSGDLIASAASLGIAHPPAYPLYVLFGKLTILVIPFGSASYRMNVFSALCAASAMVLLYQALRIVLEPRGEVRWDVRWSAALVAVLWAVCPAVVALARVAEMYALASCLGAAILLLLLLNTRASYHAACLIFGVGMAAHPTLLFLLPLFVSGYRSLGVSESQPVGVTPLLRYPVTPLLFFLSGFSVFLFLPLRAAQDPWINWGDPVTWRNFWRVLTRADYGGLKLHPEQSVLSWTPHQLTDQTVFFLRSFLAELGLPGVVFGVAGLGLALAGSQRLKPIWGLLCSWVIAGPLFVIVSNLPAAERTKPAVLQPYLILATLLWAPWIVQGVSELKKAWRVCAQVLIAGTIVFSFVCRSPSSREDFLAYDYGRNLMRSLPRGAVLYEPDDPTSFTLRALQVTENRRRDVVLLNFFRTRWGYEQLRKRQPELLPPIPIQNAQDLQQAIWSYSVRQRPFYVELPQKLGSIPYHSEGLVYAVGRAAPGDLSRFIGDEGLERSVRRGPFRTTDFQDFFARQVLGYYAAAYCNLGLEDASAGHPEAAINHYRQALCIDPHLSAALNNWGILAYARKDFDGAARLYEAALREDPENASMKRNLALTNAVKN
jgi:hypothetical protein